MKKNLEETRSEITGAYNAMKTSYEMFMEFTPSDNDKKDWHEAGKLLAILAINTAVLRILAEEKCAQFIPELQGDHYQYANPETRLLMLLRHRDQVL